MHWPIFFLASLILASCGKSNSNAGMPKDFNAPRSVTNEIEPLKQFFLANLTALNPTVSGDLAGRFTVVQTGNTFQGKMNVSTASWHKDSIHIGKRCPSMADDTNGDMIIDSNEAISAVGKVMVNLNDRSRTTYFKGSHDLRNKVILLTTSTEALACGVLRLVTNLPAETEEPRPTPRPTPTPTPTPTAEPDRDADDDEDGDNDTWADRWNEWWRCRFGGCE